jgi:hypothetical protein
MRAIPRSAITLSVIAAISGGIAAQQNGNDILATNGGEVVFIFGDPSNGGATPGSIGTGDDLDWKAVPNKVLSAVGGTTVEIDTFETMFIGDSDWNTIPRIHDLTIGPVFKTGLGVFPLCNSQVPDFFSTGSVSFLISFGPSGLPDPCSVVPTLCTAPGCPPPITGYNVDLLFGTGPGSGITYSSEIIADVGGMALTKFLPGGMPFTGTSAGSCGLGDYEFTGASSTNENQGDCVDNDGDTIPDGANYIGGFQVGGTTPTGPIPDDTGTLSEIEIGYEQCIMEVSAADVSYGPEEGGSSVILATGTGTASAGGKIHALNKIGGLVLSAATVGDPALPPSLAAKIAIPGGLPLAAFGPDAYLTLNPANPIFNATFAALAGTGPVVGIDEDGDTINDEGEASTVLLPIPPLIGISIYWQSFIICSFGPIVAYSTTTWCLKLCL